MASAVTSARCRPSPYFVSRPFDFLFVGGLSIATCLAFALTLGRAPSDAANRGAQLLMWVVNWPHFSATLYRLFRRRDSAGQYPLTAYGIPWLVTAGAFASLAWPAVAAPVFVKLFLIWSPYHFSGQSVGVSLVYARRAGVPIASLAGARHFDDRMRRRYPAPIGARQHRAGPPRRRGGRFRRLQPPCCPSTAPASVPAFSRPRPRHLRRSIIPPAFDHLRRGSGLAR